MSEKNNAPQSPPSSNKITLKRGKREVTYEKVPDQFAVRLKNEQDTAEAVIDIAKASVQHVAVNQEEALEIYTITEPTKLEKTVDALRDEPATEVVTHLYKLDESADGSMAPVGTLTVQFKPEVTAAERAAILAAYGLAEEEALDYLPHAYTLRLTENAIENPLKIAYKLQQLPEVETAEPDMSFQVALKYIPNDTLYAEQWHLRNNGNRLGLTAGADVKAEAAWDLTRGSRQITVCVMDDGFDLTHPDFNVQGKIVAPRDLLQDDNDPAPLFNDDNHGTACAGVAIAEENGVGVVGMAPRCAFMPVRMAMTLSDNAVVTLFKHAINNQADVISCSWSAAAWDFPLSTKIDAIIRHAARQGRANGAGCVILFAAGNENRPLDGNTPDGRSHQGFALHPDVIAVGASNSQDRRSAYSNFGPELTLCAPSSGSPGRRVVTTDRRGIHGYAAGDYTFTFGGTSSATPLAAGLAALILSINSKLTAAEVKEIMMETADKIDPANGDYDLAGHSPWFGHGRINAQAAVSRAQTLLDDEEGEDDTPPDAAAEVTVTIQDIDLYVVGSANNERQLLAETRFEIGGPGAAPLAANRISFRSEIELINLDNNDVSLVASGEEQLRPQQLGYVSQELFAIPPMGRYRLRSNITLLRPSGEIRATGEGPVLRVTL